MLTITRHALEITNIYGTHQRIKDYEWLTVVTSSRIMTYKQDKQ